MAFINSFQSYLFCYKLLVKLFFSNRTIDMLYNSNKYFFFFTDTEDSQDSRGREGNIFYSTLPLPPTDEHWDLFATLHMRWLSRIFNRNAFVYQTATRWNLPPYRITIWVIDWWWHVRLFTWCIDTRLMLQRFGIGNRWIWTRIDYQSRITSEPTNQVC